MQLPPYAHKKNGVINIPQRMKKNKTNITVIFLHMQLVQVKHYRVNWCYGEVESVTPDNMNSYLEHVGCVVYSGVTDY